MIPLNYLRWIEEERPSKIKLYKLKNEKSNYDKPSIYYDKPFSIYLKARRKGKSFIDEWLDFVFKESNKKEFNNKRKLWQQ